MYEKYNISSKINKPLARNNLDIQAWVKTLVILIRVLSYY